MNNLSYFDQACSDICSDIRLMSSDSINIALNMMEDLNLDNSQLLLIKDIFNEFLVTKDDLLAKNLLNLKEILAQRISEFNQNTFISKADLIGSLAMTTSLYIDVSDKHETVKSKFRTHITNSIFSRTLLTKRNQVKSCVFSVLDAVDQGQGKSVNLDKLVEKLTQLVKC